MNSTSDPLQNTLAPRRYALAVATTALGALPLAALLVLGIRELGRQALGVPRDLTSLRVPELIPAIVMPVAGTALGYFLSFRKPSPSSLRSFLIGSAIFTAIAMAITVKPLLSSSSGAALAVTIAIDIAPAAVAAMALLLFGPAARARGKG
jgi:hypothetical protein